MGESGSFRTIDYELLDTDDGNGIARITLARPETRNAQNKRMTYELDAAYMDGARRSDVKVIVVEGDGPHFSSGHDLRDTESIDAFAPIGPYGGFGRDGQEGHMALEAEIYLDMCWRWRNIPKPVVAAAHGKTIAGGLMLLWVADVIIASEDALFSDPTVGMGVNGVEFFAHPWELGPRKAKELLFTGDWFTAEEAHRLGMVNHVVPRAELSDFTMALARRIAAKPSFALKLAKESVNQTLEAQGQWTAMRAAFSLQHLGHAHNRLRFGIPVDPGAGGLVTRDRPATTTTP
jgi:enoyl-CoA hydratase